MIGLEWLRHRLSARRFAEELEDEMRLHVEYRIAEYQEDGMSYHTAKQKAVQRFGDQRQVLRECHAINGFPPPRRTVTSMESTWQHLRHAARSLARQPGYTATAVLTLALGIGANAIIFSAVHGTLLDSVPFPGGERFAWVYHQSPQGSMRLTPSAEAVSAWRAGATVLDHIAHHGQRSMVITRDGEPEQITAATASPTFLSLLQVRPTLGRLFAPEDTIPGNNRVVLLSESYWRDEFGGDADVIGRTMTLDDESHSIVGVVPGHASALSRDADLPFWLPSARGRALVRIREGVSFQDAQRELQQIQEVRVPNPTRMPDTWPITIIRPLDNLALDLRIGLWVLLGAVGFVLLIACLNVANLVLARGTGRSHELAVRAALGSSHGRILAQLFVENLLVTGAGALVGIAIAVFGVPFLTQNLPEGLEQLRATRVDARVVTVVTAVSVIIGIVIGLVPSRLVRRLDLTNLTNQNRRAGTATGGTTRQVLVMLQVALAMVLFVGAGLLVSSFVRLQRVDPGFDPSNLISFRVDLPDGSYEDNEQRTAFYDDLLARLREVPQIESAALGEVGDFYGFMEAGVVAEDNQVDAPPDREMRFNIVSPDYFRTIGMPLLQGRSFRADEQHGGSNVIVVSDAFRRAQWGTENAVGRRFKFDAESDSWYTIVGVVADARIDGLDYDPTRWQFYAPNGWISIGTQATVVVRTTGDPSDILPLIKGQVWSIDPRPPLVDVSIVTTKLADAIARPRLNACLLTALAGIALFLAAVGVYGVISLALEHRTQELGVRMALGARDRDVIRFMLRFGLRSVIAGCVLGFAGAAALSRFLASLLFEVQPTDPAVYAVVLIVMIGTGLLACAVPARRALRIDPVETLRR